MAFEEQSRGILPLFVNEFPFFDMPFGQYNLDFKFVFFFLSKKVNAENIYW